MFKDVIAHGTGENVAALHHALGLLDFLEKNAHLRGGLQPAAHAFEQVQAQLLLGLRQHAADRRLADVQQPGGAADRAGGNDGPQHFGLAVAQFIQSVHSMPICYTLFLELLKA